MNKQWLAIAMLGAMLSVGLASTEDTPEAQPSTAEAQKSSQKDAACATQSTNAGGGDASAPQNQVEYGGGA